MVPLVGRSDCRLGSCLASTIYAIEESISNKNALDSKVMVESGPKNERVQLPSLLLYGRLLGGRPLNPL